MVSWWSRYAVADQLHRIKPRRLAFPHHLQGAEFKQGMGSIQRTRAILTPSVATPRDIPWGSRTTPALLLGVFRCSAVTNTRASRALAPAAARGGRGQRRFHQRTAGIPRW